jgi:carboxyl-terminal processing protease
LDVLHRFWGTLPPGRLPARRERSLHGFIRAAVARALICGMLVACGSAALAETTPAPALSPELAAFVEAYQRIKTRYVGQIDDKKLIADAINGMLSGLDPHSAYLDAEAYRDLKVATRGEFGGLGIEVGIQDGLVKVIAAIEDTPAHRAGLKPGDVILKLDDIDVKGMSLTEAIGRARGKPDTDISLTIMREGNPTPQLVKLTRAVIPIQSVDYRLIEPGYAYVHVSQFQERTAEKVVDALASMWRQNRDSLNGVILDLRNDPGGLVSAAVGVSAVFLHQGALVVTIQGRTEESRRNLYAASEDYLRNGREDFMQRLPAAIKDIPMVVLVNGGSASASEIVAGALQDHKRAVIVGTQSFGKGSVQAILPLGNSAAIKLTTAQYYTPNLRSIQATGITPDIVVGQASKTAAPQKEIDLGDYANLIRDSQLMQALNLLKSLDIVSQR